MAGRSFPLGSGKRYPGKLTSYVRFSCIIAASGGLIFGYDLGIIGGVTSMDPFLKKFFPELSSTENRSVKPSNDQYCHLERPTILTVYASLIYIATIFSSVMVSLYDKRHDMIFGGLVCTIGAIFNCFAVNGFMIGIGRFFIGIGIGFAIHSIPIYIAEMAPFRYRRAFNIVFQLSISIGMLVARLLNYFMAKFDSDWGWRISLGGSVLPSLILFLSFFFLSDSPYSLLGLNKINDAKAQLRKIRGIYNVNEEFNDLAKACNTAKSFEYRWHEILKDKYRPQFILAMLISLCQQVAGINVIYAPLLFKSMGFDSNASVMSALITSIVFFGATLIAIETVGRYGSKTRIFFFGSLQMLLGQVMMTISVASKSGTSSASQLPTWFSIIVVISMCIYVTGFAYSWGPLGLLVPTEILPHEVRSTGQSLILAHSIACSSYNITNFLPYMLCYLKFGFFIIFTICVAGISIFILKFMPRGKMHN